MMRPIIVLSLICMVASALLAGVNQMTFTPIVEAQKQLKVDALAEIFPFEIGSVKVLKDGGTTFYEIRSEDKELKGIGIETFTEEGYGGRIDVLLGVSPEGDIFDYQVVASKETPGLGIKIADSGFRKQFRGRSLTNGFAWKVKKDGGDVDAITAATISSRAITDALERGLNLFTAKYKQKPQIKES